MIRLLIYILLPILFVLLLRCKTEEKKTTKIAETTIFFNKIDSIILPKKTDHKIMDTCQWNTYLRSQNLVNIQNIDSSIMVELKYSSTDNFMHKDMYGCLDSCFLQYDVAKKLSVAQQLLKKINPQLSLLVYDGVRPRSVQQYMWDILDMPINEKVKFVSNPKRGSLHNFGAAVDITIYSLDSLKPLDMGTPYDYIGIKAWPIKENFLLKKRILNKQQIENRRILRKVMTKAKFFNIQTEWWHFNSCYRKEAYQLYSIIEGIDNK